MTRRDETRRDGGVVAVVKVLLQMARDTKLRDSEVIILGLATG